MLDDVSQGELLPNGVPQVQFDRLNEHYCGVVTLARLILQPGAFEAGRGDVGASGFLMDMNDVFQEFAAVTLREAWGTPDRLFGERRIPSLDEDGQMRLLPDLVWQEDPSPVFVGDARYKRIDDGVPNADLHQLLAYAIASGFARRITHLRARGTRTRRHIRCGTPASGWRSLPSI